MQRSGNVHRRRKGEIGSLDAGELLTLGIGQKLLHAEGMTRAWTYRYLLLYMMKEETERREDTFKGAPV